MSRDLLNNKNSTYDSYYDNKQDKILDIIQKYSFESLRDRGEFDAFVLGGYSYDSATSASPEQSGRYLGVYLRPKDLIGFQLPPPCPNSNSEAAFITSLHPMGFSESPMVSSGMLFNVGDLVSCYFDYRAPAFKGQMRGLRFRIGVIERALGNYDLSCLSDKMSSLSFNGVGTPLPTDGDYKETIVGQCRKGVPPGWYHNDAAAQEKLKAELLAAYPAIKPILNDFVRFCASMGIPDASWLANLINMESGWNTKAKNKHTHASGLIQWMPEYCPKLVGDPEPTGTSEEILAARRKAAAKVRKQSITWQWGKVKRRYSRYKGRLNTSADVYTAVFYPWAVGKPMNTDVAGHWAGNINNPKKRQRRIAVFMTQNGGIRYKGDYARLASGKAKLPTRFC